MHRPVRRGRGCSFRGQLQASASADRSYIGKMAVVARLCSASQTGGLSTRRRAFKAIRERLQARGLLERPPSNSTSERVFGEAQKGKLLQRSCFEFSAEAFSGQAPLRMDSHYLALDHRASGTLRHRGRKHADIHLPLGTMLDEKPGTSLDLVRAVPLSGPVW